MIEETHGVERCIDDMGRARRKFDTAQGVGQPSKIGREILAHFEFVIESENGGFAPDADDQRTEQRTEFANAFDGLFLEIGLNGDGQRDGQEIAVFVNLLRDVVVVELEIGGGESVDEVAAAIGNRSWGDDQAYGNAQDGLGGQQHGE